jgi:hypothetical protein
MAEAKQKPAKKAVEGVKASPTVTKAVKTEIKKDPCESCKYTKGGVACRTCVEFK